MYNTIYTVSETMDMMVVLSNKLLLEMNRYGKAMDMIGKIVVEITQVTRQRQSLGYRYGDLDILLARLATLNGVRIMYEEYRMHKWSEIVQLNEDFQDLAASIDIDDYADLLTEQREFRDIPIDSDLTMSYFSRRDASFSRLE